MNVKLAAAWGRLGAVKSFRSAELSAAAQYGRTPSHEHALACALGVSILKIRRFFPETQYLLLDWIRHTFDIFNIKLALKCAKYGLSARHAGELFFPYPASTADPSLFADGGSAHLNKAFRGSALADIVRSLDGMRARGADFAAIEFHADLGCLDLLIREYAALQYDSASVRKFCAEELSSLRESAAVIPDTGELPVIETLESLLSEKRNSSNRYPMDSPLTHLEYFLGELGRIRAALRGEG